MSLQKLQVQLQADGHAALLVNNIANVQWLTGFTGSFGSLLVTPSGATFITDSRYAIQAAEQVHGVEIRTFGNPVRFEHVVADLAKEKGLSEVGFEPTVTYGTFERWAGAWPDFDLKPMPDLIAPLRMIKSADEVAKIAEACKLADATMEHVSRLIQPGVRELDIHLDLEFFIRRNGAYLGFEPIVVSGPNSARPHGKATERKLEVGDFVTIDLGAKLDGWNSDITRTFVVGKATDRHREIYDQVLRALLECTQKLVPGVPTKDVDAHARAVLGEKDLAKYFGHGLGHGLGRDVHDFGGLSPLSNDTVAVGQVWTVEPGVYIEGFGGVRIEDDVHVSENGPVVLTHFPRELMELG